MLRGCTHPAAPLVRATPLAACSAMSMHHIIDQLSKKHSGCVHGRSPEQCTAARGTRSRAGSGCCSPHKLLAWAARGLPGSALGDQRWQRREPARLSKQPRRPVPEPARPLPPRCLKALRTPVLLQVTAFPRLPRPTTDRREGSANNNRQQANGSGHRPLATRCQAGAWARTSR